MAKFYGKVGYSVTTETKPGVWTPSITERMYSGDFVRNTTRKLESSGGVNDNVIISNDVSIIADPFANENFSSIIYVEIMGTKWKVSSAEIQYPRVLLILGGVYNG